MIECDIPNHSTYQILNHFVGEQLRGKNVAHIGGHNGLERDIYNLFGVKRVDWFECNKYVYPELLERLRGYKNHYPHFVCLTDKDNDEREYHVYRDKKDGASGLFLPDKMNDYVDCKPTGESWKVKTVTYDTYANDAGLPKDIFLLVLDVQGAELEVLKGANSLLKQESLTWLYIEVSMFSCYKDAPQEADVTNYLRQFGFECIGYREDWNLGKMLHGDNVYWRGK